MLFFAYGYGLYARRELIDMLRDQGTLAALWASAAVVFLVHLGLIGAIDEMSKSGADAESIELVGLVIQRRLLRGLGGAVHHRAGRAL